ncbi:hypothetical protein Tsubulata_006507, partial [Turnera subulata]
DRMSGCRSFGSNYHPSSQRRKMSIGIVIDSLAKRKSGATKEDKCAIPDGEKEVPGKESSIGGRTKKDAANANGRKESEAVKEVSSPWITKHKPPASETILHAKETVNLPTTTGRKNKLSRKTDAPLTHTVEFFANQTSTLHADNGERKKFGGLTYKRKGSKDSGSQRAEEFTFATPGDIPVSDKAVIDDKTANRGNETLKQKLWEILGAVSSPKSQPSASPAPEIGANSSKQDLVVNKKAGVAKPKHNSDTIETDSESPDQRKKRPVTRSLTRRRASNTVQAGKGTAGPSSTHKQKNVFSFEEGLFGKRNVTVKSSSTSIRTKRKTNSCKIEPRKIFFTESSNVDNIAATFRSKTTLPVKKTSSLGGKRGIFHAHSSQNKREQVEPKSSKEQKGSRQCPARDSHKSSSTDSRKSLGTDRTEPPVAFNSPAVPEKGYQHEDFSNSPLKNAVGSQNDFGSPTFKINTPLTSSSPSPAPDTDQIKEVLSSPAPEKTGFNVGNVHSLRNLRNLNEDYYTSNTQNQSVSLIIFKNGARGLTDSPPGKASPLKGKRDLEGDLSESSSGDTDIGSSDDDSPFIKGQRNRETFAEEPSVAERSKSILHTPKGLSKPKADKARIFRPTSPPRNVIGESDWMPDPSQQTQEGELERVTMLLALALENFKNKMKAAARKKSSEILMSVYEEIQSQLQNVDSQIQSDLGKLTSLGKSKRKRVETRFQDSDLALIANSVLTVLSTFYLVFLHSIMQSKSVVKLEQKLVSGQLLKVTPEFVIKVLALLINNFMFMLPWSCRQSDECKNISQQTNSLCLLLPSYGSLGQWLVFSNFFSPAEQQEQLKLIHEKFRQDIYQHLQEWQNTLEGLEEHQNELKGTVKKQKASHQKLLAQVEETVVTQISSAERRITAVHKASFLHHFCSFCHHFFYDVGRYFIGYL